MRGVKKDFAKNKKKRFSTVIESCVFGLYIKSRKTRRGTKKGGIQSTVNNLRLCVRAAKAAFFVLVFLAASFEVTVCLHKFDLFFSCVFQ